jgi:hypothetical protein
VIIGGKSVSLPLKKQLSDYNEEFESSKSCPRIIYRFSTLCDGILPSAWKSG